MINHLTSTYTHAKPWVRRWVQRYIWAKSMGVYDFRVSDYNMAYDTHPTFDPTWLEVGERNQHDYAIAIVTAEHRAPTGWAVMESRDAAFAEGLSMDYFNACVKDALAFNW